MIRGGSTPVVAMHPRRRLTGEDSLGPDLGLVDGDPSPSGRSENRFFRILRRKPRRPHNRHDSGNFQGQIPDHLL
jgi:hypothetical protein